MKNFSLIEVVVISDGIISVDGELFYLHDSEHDYPYHLFNMVKIKLHYSGSKGVFWDERNNILTIPSVGIKNRNSMVYRHFSSFNRLFFSNTDIGFVNTLSKKFVGSELTGPNPAIEARKVVSSIKIPKVIKSDVYYYFYDEKLYAEFAR